MKYLNGVLTVIAICLVLITFAIVGFIPTAGAKEPHNPKMAIVPLNADGSITVRLAKGETIDVNIEQVDGTSVLQTIPIDIQEVRGHNVNAFPLPVTVEK